MSLFICILFLNLLLSVYNKGDILLEYSSVVRKYS